MGRSLTFADLSETERQQLLARAPASGVDASVAGLQAQITALQALFGATALASEAIAAGAAVNVWNNGGVISARNANATDATKPCDGFAAAGAAMGHAVAIMGDGQVVPTALLTAILGGAPTPAGLYYLATTAGEIQTAKPVVTGNLQQFVGRIVNEGLLINIQQGSPVSP